MQFYMETLSDLELVRCFMQTMALKVKVMLMVQLLLLLCVVSTSPKSGITAELEDTIHALREENSYLQERLESLTVALRQLRKLLWDHSKESTDDLDSNEPHFWDDWSEFGKRTDAYQLLEQAFCGKELRGAARCSPRAHGVLLLFSLCLAHLL